MERCSDVGFGSRVDGLARQQRDEAGRQECEGAPDQGLAIYSAAAGTGTAVLLGSGMCRNSAHTTDDIRLKSARP